jgi:uncharacterized protein (UPF0333 family)
MTPEERRLLEETHALTQENSNILKSIQRAGRVSMAFRVLYWGVIIASSVGAYYLIQPYVDTLKEAYSGLGL